jgi:hypothetical protein
VTGAAAFIWIVAAVLALAWLLTQTGTVRLGVDFGFWINLLLVLAVLGAALNLFVLPFLSRSRKTTTTSTTAADTAAGAAPGAGAPAARAAQREAVQETKEQPPLS